MTAHLVATNPSLVDLHALWRELGETTRIDVDEAGGSFTVHTDKSKSRLDAALAAHIRPDYEAQFTSAVAAIDTSKIADPDTRAALEALKAVLSGGKGPGAEPRRGPR